MKLPLLAIIFFAVATVAGCAGGSKVVRSEYAYGCPAGADKIYSKEDLIKAKVEPAGSLHNIEVVDLRCGNRAGLLRIDVDLKNESREERRVAYRLRWLDKDGMRAWDDETWKPLLINGNTLYTITASSPSPDATDFRVVIMDQDQ